MVDRFTRWPEALPLTGADTEEMARAFIFNWISRFGVPQEMSSDRGPQFTSKLWSAICKLLGTHLNKTTAYHAQANGLVERFHRRLKDSLKSKLTGPNWMDQLPWVLLGIRSEPKEDLEASTAELVYGSPLTVPGDFVPFSDSEPKPEDIQELRDKVSQFVPVPMSTHGNTKSYVPSKLLKAEYVFIRQDSHRKPLQTPYTGPYKVLESGNKKFKIQIGSRQETVSIDRLKPAILDKDSPVKVAVPPLRGRPRKIAENVPIEKRDRKPPIDLHILKLLEKLVKNIVFHLKSLNNSGGAL